MGGYQVLGFEPDFIVHLVWFEPSRFHPEGLGAFHSFLSFPPGVLELPLVPFHSWHFADALWLMRPWNVPHPMIKRGYLCCFRLPGFQHVLDHGNVVLPIILLEVTEDSERCFDMLIRFL